MEDKHTLNFAYLDDLKPRFNLNITFRSMDQIAGIITDIWKLIQDSDIIHRFDEAPCSYKDEVIHDLRNEGYWCWNQYYVIAFAIDYATFTV